MTSFIQQILQKKTSCSVSGDQSRLQAPSKALVAADQRNPLEVLSRHASRRNLLPFLPTIQLLELTLMVYCANLKTDPVINLDSNRSGPVERFTHYMNLAWWAGQWLICLMVQPHARSFYTELAHQFFSGPLLFVFSHHFAPAGRNDGKLSKRLTRPVHF